MDKLITYDTLRLFTYSNDKLISGEIRGIAIEFRGLGVDKMYTEDSSRAQRFADAGIIFLIPYNNPWAWMNRQAIATTDELVDVLFEHYTLPADTPIVSTGPSMGGQSALVYCRYARRMPAACVVNCPVCDLPYHYTERPDLPSTLYSAFWNEPGRMEDVLKSYSPLDLADELPDTPYTVFHCEADTQVNKQLHSDRFVEAMWAKGKSVEYIPVPGRDHCDLPPEVWEQYFETIISSVR